MIYLFSRPNYLAINLRSIFLSFILITSIPIFSQNLSPLAEDFLEGLPPSVREEIEVQNQVEQEEDLEKLFRSDTSVEKNKVILRNLQEQLRALELRLSKDDDKDPGGIKRFGDSFFQTFQSSFMPVNVPNIGSSYIVDVGDVFKFSRSGQKNDVNELMVGRDGTLELPGSGKIQVAGRTLNQVEELVDTLIAATQIGTTHMLSLQQLRDVQIIIVGGVENPGIYTLSGGSNILGGLHVAGGVSEKGSFRNVELRRGGETISKLDLYDLFVYGNFDNKNTLRSGDTIFVHPIQFQVPLTGGVNNSSIYELVSGETISDLIGFASGFSEGFEGYDSVTVSRDSQVDRTFLRVSIEDLDKFELRPRDSVLVPSYSYEATEIYKVYISGMVEQPGNYYINPGDTLSSLIERAGGYREGAYEYGAALFRKSAIDQEKLFAQMNYSDTVNYIVSSLGKPGINISTDILGLLGEEVRSRSYHGRVITEFNLNKLKTNPSQDKVLQNNDQIVIPRLEKIVYAFGDFKNPANFSYSSNLNIHDYIEMAGGLKDSADNEIIVIDPDGRTQVYTKAFLRSSSIDIYPGSIIYAQRDISKIKGVQYAATISPILSSLAISLASLNSISD